MKHDRVEETFNCTFPLFLASSKTKISKSNNGCRIRDLGKNGSAVFREIIRDIGQGRFTIIFISTKLWTLFNLVPKQKMVWKETFLIGQLRSDGKETCSAACTVMEVKYGYPFIYEAKKNSSGSITLYFKKLITIRESHLKYEAGSLFAEIGGYTGLLLGVSVLDISKIIGYCWDRIKTCTIIQKVKQILRK